jgi:hypothetical protein
MLPEVLDFVPIVDLSILHAFYPRRRLGGGLGELLGWGDDYRWDDQIGPGIAGGADFGGDGSDIDHNVGLAGDEGRRHYEK